MATNRVIKGVLRNFLGTFTSRYSDFNGYWLFGFLINDLADAKIDLRTLRPGTPVLPSDFAAQLAALKFAEQLLKAGLIENQVSEAWLTMRKSPEQVVRPVNGRPSRGYTVVFFAEATMASGGHFTSQQVVFVAPHDPSHESRSTRAA